jgi:hypothetical protein
MSTELTSKSTWDGVMVEIYLPRVLEPSLSESTLLQRQHERGNW